MVGFWTRNNSEVERTAFSDSKYQFSGLVKQNSQGGLKEHLFVKLKRGTESSSGPG